MSPLRSRVRWVLGCGLMLAAVVLPARAASATPPRSSPAPAVVLPVDVVFAAAGPGCPSWWGVGDMCDAVTDPFEAVGDAAVGAGAAMVNGIFDQFAAWIVKGATAMARMLASVVEDTTTPDLCGSSGSRSDETSTMEDCRRGWFFDSYATMRAVATIFMLPLVLLAVFQALLHQSMGALARLVFVKLPLAGVFMLSAVLVVDLLVKGTDNLGEFVSQSITEDSQSFFTTFVKALGTLGAATGQGVAGFGFATLVLGFGATLIAFVLWLELALRQAAIYAVTLFLPLAFAGLVWPATSRWMKRLAEVLLAFILAKFVIVSILALAAAALSSGKVSMGASGFAPVVTGLALMLLACFAPYALMKVIPVAELAAISTMEGMSRRPIHAAPTPMTAMTAAAMVQSRRGNGVGHAAAPAASSVAPSAGGGAVSAGVGAAGSVRVAAGAATAPRAAGVRLGAGAEAVAGNGASTDGAPSAGTSGRMSMSSPPPRSNGRRPRRSPPKGDGDGS